MTGQNRNPISPDLIKRKSRGVLSERPGRIYCRKRLLGASGSPLEPSENKCKTAHNMKKLWAMPCPQLNGTIIP